MKASTMPAHTSSPAAPATIVNRSEATARNRSAREVRLPQPMSAPARMKPHWPPSRMAGISMEPCGRSQRAQDDAVVEEQNQGAGAPGDARRQGHDGDLNVVGHQLGGE